MSLPNTKLSELYTVEVIPRLQHDTDFFRALYNFFHDRVFIDRDLVKNIILNSFENETADSFSYADPEELTEYEESLSKRFKSIIRSQLPDNGKYTIQVFLNLRSGDKVIFIVESSKIANHGINGISVYHLTDGDTFDIEGSKIYDLIFHEKILVDHACD